MLLGTRVKVRKLITKPGPHVFFSVMDRIQQNRVTVMVGSYSSLVASMADSLQVPYVTLDLHEASLGTQSHPFMFSLYPSGSLVKHVAKDVADYYRWKEVCIIYNIDDGKSDVLDCCAYDVAMRQFETSSRGPVDVMKFGIW
jgi:hypothetical protein